MLNKLFASKWSKSQQNVIQEIIFLPDNDNTQAGSNKTFLLLRISSETYYEIEMTILSTLRSVLTTLSMKHRNKTFYYWWNWYYIVIIPKKLLLMHSLSFVSKYCELARKNKLIMIHF